MSRGVCCFALCPGSGVALARLAVVVAAGDGERAFSKVRGKRSATCWDCMISY